MKRGFRGVPRPLLPVMLPIVAVDQSAGPADQAVDQPSPSEPFASSSHPPVISATPKPKPTPIAEPTPHPNSPLPEPDNESTKHTFEQPSPEHQPLSPRQETEVPQSQDSTHPHVAEERTMTVDDLLQLVPKLITKVDSLETELKQTKLTMGKALVKLVKKVKKMEDVLKRRQVVLPDSEDEDAEISSKQGRNLQEEGLDEMVRNMIKDKSEVFKTPTQSKTLGEEDISPTTLEAAKTLSKVASQRSKSVDKSKKKTDKEESVEAMNPTPLDTKSNIVANWKIFQQGERSIYQIIRANGADTVYMSFGAMLKDFTREDLIELYREKSSRSNFAIEEGRVSGSEKEVLCRRKSTKEEEVRPMTQSQLRNYMMNYLKNQGTWKLTHLKKLSFEEVKEEFDKLVKQTDEEESVEAMNPTPLDTKSNIVANWKIFQQGERSIYQIIRANGVDTVYMSFGAMLKDFIREDLIELYKLVMQKYGTNRPEDAYDRVLWSDLRTMFDPPLNEDAIWSYQYSNWDNNASCRKRSFGLKMLPSDSFENEVLDGR
ncbi:hypothetical protein Tco_0722684 [Tanacetum coccineum]